MDNPAQLLFTALICFGIGFALHGLINGLRSERTAKKSVDQRADGGLTEILRLWWDAPGGKLVPEIQGKRFAKPDGLNAAERARLLQSFESLGIWINGTAPGAAAVTLSGQPVSAGLPGVSECEQPARPGMNPFDMLARAAGSDASRPAAGTISMAAQIDEILQTRLDGNAYAHLTERAIRLTEIEGKGLVVMVGLNMYDGVGSVPDPEIQKLIRDCVQEWERG